MVEGSEFVTQTELLTTAPPLASHAVIRSNIRKKNLFGNVSESLFMRRGVEEPLPGVCVCFNACVLRLLFEVARHLMF